MARFDYQARDASGRVVRGLEEADSELDLGRRLDGRQLFLVRSRTRNLPAPGRVSAQVLIDFFYHVATAIEGGISLLEALSDIARDLQHPLAMVSEDVRRSIADGASFSAALAAHPKIFSPLSLALVQAGERTGKLGPVLMDLVRHLEWREELRRQLIGALAYPATALAAIVGLCAIVTTLVLPKFLGIFREVGVELPPTTRLLIAASDFLGAHGPLLLVAAAGAGFALAFALRTEAGRWAWHGLLLRLPVLGSLHRMTEMSRFTHNLGLLYAAGLGIVEALRLVADVVQNARVRRALLNTHEAVTRGEPLTDSLAREDMVPPLAMRMLRIGEVSGRLDGALERVAVYYDREVPAAIRRLLGVFNVGMLLFLAGALLLVAFSIFVPLYQMMGELGA